MRTVAITFVLGLVSACDGGQQLPVPDAIIPEARAPRARVRIDSSACTCQALSYKAQILRQDGISHLNQCVVKELEFTDETPQLLEGIDLPEKSTVTIMVVAHCVLPMCVSCWAKSTFTLSDGVQVSLALEPPPSCVIPDPFLLNARPCRN